MKTSSTNPKKAGLIRLLLLWLLFSNGFLVVAQPSSCTGQDPGGSPAASGLYAEYYGGYFADDHTYFTRNTRPIGQQAIVPVVDFANAAAWPDLTGVASSGSAANADGFSLRLRGSLNIAVAGTYTFYLTSDDASWLWLDAAARALPATDATATIENSGTHPTAVVSQTVTLTQGLHSLLIEYGEDSGDNVLQLEYENLAAGITRRIVPASAFCTAQQGPVSPRSAVFSPSIYTGPTGTALSSVAPTVADGGSAVTGFAAGSALPAGFSLNSSTGVFMAAATVVPGTYALDLSVSNANGTSTFGNVVIFQILGTPPPGCIGNDPGGNPANSGLYAQYFAGYFNDAPGYFVGRPAGLTRVDAQVNFAETDSFGNLLPTASGTATNPDNFSLQLRGSLRIATAGTYTFYLNSDDASLLWLDNAALASPAQVGAATIDNGGLHGPRTVQASVYLVAGLHNVLLHYGEADGLNTAVLEYEGPDSPTRQVVPSSAFCTATQPLRALPGSLQYSPATQTVVNGTAAISVTPSISSATPVQFVLANAASLPVGIAINTNTGQLSLSAAVPTGLYRIDVSAINAEGSTTFSQVYSFAVAPAPPAGCAGTRPDGGAPTGGFYAEYFSGYFNNDLAYFTNNTPGLTRIETELNYRARDNWGDLSAVATPDADDATDPNQFSARYRGSILISTAGSYRFTLTSDDASWLWVGNAALMSPPLNSLAVVDNGGNHPVATVSGTVTLEAGLQDILVLYGENNGDNQLVLEYQGPDAPAGQVLLADRVCSASSGRPLPVELVSFGATPGSKGVELRWATAQELNSAYFAVERSANGVVFEQVARVAAAGTTSQRQQYHIIDAAPLAGLSYYRLRQVDIDGTIAYSPVVAVTSTSKLRPLVQLMAAPNPSHGRFEVQITQSQPTFGTLQLLDMRGRLCYQTRLAAAAEQQVLLQLPGLAAGVYILRLSTENGSATHKVVVE